MTRKVFWENSYQTELDTRVAAVSGADVTLAETIFYALSGGQESDHGTIGGYPVVTARKADPDIVYELPTDHTLRPGDAVHVVIDWDRRYRLMRLHFAAELILELIYKSAPDTAKVGAHIAATKARIDFAWEGNIADEFPHLLADAHALIARDLPVISDFSDRENERRYWAVDGFAQVPCGGTHLRRTGEVGPLRLKRNNIGKGKERIEIYLDEPAA